MAEMKTLNGYEIVDEKARQEIELLKQNSGGGLYIHKITIGTNVTDAFLRAEMQYLSSYQEPYTFDTIKNANVLKMCANNVSGMGTMENYYEFNNGIDYNIYFYDAVLQIGTTEFWYEDLTITDTVTEF